MESSETKFTVKMSGAVSEVMSKMKTFYCREDFAYKVREVMDQYNKKQSGYKSRLKELEMMSAACGVDAERLCNPKTYADELGKIRTKEELYKEFMKELHEIYKKFPTSIQFMDRVVRRRLGGEFKDDSLRMAILKKFLQKTDYHVKPVIEWAERIYSDTDREAYAKMDIQKKREFVINHLDEKFFDHLIQEKQEMETVDWIYFLLQKIDADEEKGFVISDELADKLKDILQMFGEKADPVEGGVEILRRIAGLYDDRDCADEDPEILKETIKDVEKEFCKYLKKFTYQKKTGKPGTKDEIYKQAKKDLLKSLKTDWELLRLADDLANGKFRVNGITKEQLYIFAIVFDMKIYFDKEKEGYDADRDLEKNLFFDFYNDNLLRYVLDKEYDENRIFYEGEPSGEGINYKNYVEVIYLYYIYREDLKLTPNEKLRKVQSMVRKCLANAKKSENRVKAAPTDKTVLYRSNCIDILMTIDDERQLVDYICENYYIYDPEKKAARILFASEQNTAKEKWCEIISDMQNDFYGEFINSEKKADVDFGIETKLLFEDLRKRFGEDKEFTEKVLDDKLFYQLLQKLDEKLHIRKRGIFLASGINKEKDRFTRTEIITVYYCYFLNLLDELIDDFEIVDLPGLYDAFCEGYDERKGINAYLEECRYQKISEKNIFDMFIIFSLFLEQLW